MGAHILGDFRTQPHCELPESYFTGRDCWVDCRAPDMLHISRDCNIGWEARLVCQSHNPMPGKFGDVTARSIIIRPKAFIAGFATLYNCEIGEGSVVALGAVVRSRIVPPWVIVEGNPARIVSSFDHVLGKWVEVPGESGLGENLPMRHRR
jgi:acetyltransferase-like isoleucine patch superfamily enzyme